MAEPQIRFEDGAAYERMMGVWSRIAGEVFVNWLDLPKGLRCLDVGCGNGAFTELLIECCAPAEVHGVDPSEGQLKFARTRPGVRLAQFHQGDAMALPFPDNRFDAAFMALVIFFVTDPVKAVAEMVRAVRPGGFITAYAWDALGGGFPLDPLQREMRTLGYPPKMPPSAEASQLENLKKLWSEGGLEQIATREITVERTYPDFEDFWTTSLFSPSTGSVIMAMPTDARETLRDRVQAKLPADADGRITLSARANAVKGRKPA
jgi:ubiquinone/menaquinone biosynthesis C-methylase UbiE